MRKLFQRIAAVCAVRLNLTCFDRNIAKSHIRKGNHKLVSSVTREDSVKDRAGHWLQAGWRSWRDAWDFEGRRAAAKRLP